MAFRPEFDMHISLGSILGILSILGAVGGFYFSVENQLTHEIYEMKWRLGNDIVLLKQQVEQHGKDIDKLSNEYHKAWGDVGDRIERIEGKVNDIRVLLGPPKDGRGR